MSSTLEQLIRRAAERPSSSREALFQALLSADTYVIHVGARGQAKEGEKTASFRECFSLWADEDELLGGVWVPVFTSAELASSFVSERGLEAPDDQEFYWMGHEPGKVFGVLQSIDRFAGIRLNPGRTGGICVAWPEVNGLALGLVPPAGPFLYELPLDEFQVPRGTKVLVGPMDPEMTGMEGSQAIFPDHADVQPEDFRSLVALRLAPSIEDAEKVWTPCRHLALALKRWLEVERKQPACYLDALIRCLMGFEMYGEAESICDGLSTEKGREAYAWVYLSAIYGRTGRLKSCTELCDRGMRKYAKERAFYLNQARAYSQLDDRIAAKEAAQRGLELFPGDTALLRFL